MSPVYLDVGAAGQDDDSKEERDQAPGHDARDPDQGHDQRACMYARWEVRGGAALSKRGGWQNGV